MIQVHQHSDPIKRKSQKITQNVHINKRFTASHKINLFEKEKKNLQRHSQSTRPIFSLALSLCLQISIPTYIHTFLVLSPILSPK